MTYSTCLGHDYVVSKPSLNRTYDMPSVVLAKILYISNNQDIFRVK